MRYGKKCKLKHYEVVLANIAVECEFAYSAMGAVGFNYQSAKDATRWHGLKLKLWLKWVLAIGRLLAISEDRDFNKAVSFKTHGSKDIAAALIAVFGSGKPKKP